MVDTVHALRTCTPGYAAAALALDLAAPCDPITVHISRTHATVLAHSDPLCCEAHGDSTRVDRSFAQHVAANLAPCDTCDDWDPMSLRPDDNTALLALADWIEGLNGLRLHDTNPTWRGGPHAPTTTWHRAVRLLSNLGGAHGEPATRVRLLLLEALGRLNNLEKAKTDRARQLLGFWTMEYQDFTDVVDERLAGIPDLVRSNAEAVHHAAHNGTDEQAREWHERLNESWVWAPVDGLSYYESSATLLPDMASALSGMVRLPTAALWHSSRTRDPIPDYVHAPDAHPDDIHTAAGLADGVVSRIEDYAAALAAARV